jgi:hypothetical protein
MKIKYEDVETPRIRVVMGAYSPYLVLPEYMEGLPLKSIDLLLSGWTEELLKKKKTKPTIEMQ